MFACFRDVALARCKEHIELIAIKLGLEGFSRIDAFVHVDTGEVSIIRLLKFTIFILCMYCENVVTCSL